MGKTHTGVFIPREHHKTIPHITVIYLGAKILLLKWLTRDEFCYGRKKKLPIMIYMKFIEFSNSRLYSITDHGNNNIYPWWDVLAWDISWALYTSTPTPKSIGFIGSNRHLSSLNVGWYVVPVVILPLAVWHSWSWFPGDWVIYLILRWRKIISIKNKHVINHWMIKHHYLLLCTVGNSNLLNLDVTKLTVIFKLES